MTRILVIVHESSCNPGRLGQLWRDADADVVEVNAWDHPVPPTVDADALVDEVLEEVQLVPQSGQLPGTLSSGQRRRLGLATALVRPRKLLVLDEPEARLDVEGVAWLGKRLREEMNHGLAIIMASHEPALVETLGARIVELGGPRG